jgi:hypothetical protein
MHPLPTLNKAGGLDLGFTVSASKIAQCGKKLPDVPKKCSDTTPSKKRLSDEKKCPIGPVKRAFHTGIYSIAVAPSERPFGYFFAACRNTITLSCCVFAGNDEHEPCHTRYLERHLLGSYAAAVSTYPSHTVLLFIRAQNGRGAKRNSTGSVIPIVVIRIHEQEKHCCFL